MYRLRFATCTKQFLTAGGKTQVALNYCIFNQDLIDSYQ